MEYQIKLNPIQKIAIFWIKNIDSNLLLFNTLKSLNQGFRLFFYAGLAAFTIFAMKFVMVFIDFSTAPMAGLWTFLSQVVFYGVMIGMSLIFTLESVMKIDVPQILKEQKEKKEKIKIQKLQFWRLRNMNNIFVRILVYISFYLLCVFIIQIASTGAFIDIFAAAKSGAETDKQIAIFIQSYESFIRWFTFIYLAGGLTLDYFVNKKIAQKIKEAQNEIIA